MRLLRRVVLAGAVICPVIVAPTGVLSAQTKSIPKLKAEPKSLEDKMTWLRQSIAQTGGFARNQSSSASSARLDYEFQGQQLCELSWRPVTAGNEELLRDYPGIEQVEDLKGIAPESVRVEPVDVRGLLAGGTGQSSVGEAGVYWKIAASYVDGTRLPPEAFEFVFADRETAQRVAEVLSHEVSLCHGAKVPEMETDIGCDPSPTLKVTVEGGVQVDGKYKVPPAMVWKQGSLYVNGSVVNRAGTPLSCVVEMTYYARRDNTAWVRNEYLTFDLTVGEMAGGLVHLPQYQDATPLNFYLECFAQSAVNVAQHTCADLKHPMHITLEKMAPKRP